MLPLLVRQGCASWGPSMTAYGISLFDTHQTSTYYVLGTHCSRCWRPRNRPLRL